MSRRELRVLREGGAFFEAPRWRDGRWWVSDFYRHVVVRVDEEGHEEVVAEVPGQPSGLGFLPDGRLLVVSMRDHRVLRQEPDGGLSLHADLSGYAGGWLNDMVVDRAGRAYVGDFGFDLMAGADPRPTGLERVDPDGTVTRVAEGLFFPNGAVVTPDGRRLVVGETGACRYRAFRIESDGALVDEGVWAQLAPEPVLGTFAETMPQIRVAPDGCCLDAEGCIWSADAVGRRCLRVAPGGEVLEQVDAPEGLGIFACMLGGDDGRTLLLCAAPDFFEQLRSTAREAVLLTTRVEVPHAGLP